MVFCRLRTSVSPQKNWPLGRPPATPKTRAILPLPHGRIRRSSAQTPSASKPPYFAQPVLNSNRSRSLDGLLDAPLDEEPYVEKETVKPNEQPPKKETSDAGEENTSTAEGEEPGKVPEAEAGTRETESDDEAGNLTKSRSCEAHLNSDEDSSSEFGGSTLSLSNSGDSKPKQNFMNKCVNKVKNLIRK
ncbi:hypothetical protein RUM43_006000 [Polyplax serrata]|uniref:Uncharacterized protein n=1 Tax=Polyplax serrata TaxID=468196 RepID=A0AAN8PY60_POLSC